MSTWVNNAGLLVMGPKQWYFNLSGSFKRHGKTWLQQTHIINKNYLNKFNKLIEKNGYLYTYGYVIQPISKVEYIFKITRIVQNKYKKIPPPDNTATPYGKYDTDMGECDGVNLEYHLWLEVSAMEKIKPLPSSDFILIKSGNRLKPNHMVSPIGRFYVSIENIDFPSEKNVTQNNNLTDSPFDPTEEKYLEGKTIKVFVNRYERNEIAKQKCLNHYGTKCRVCNFDFLEVYGEIGRDFIHVHHLKPLSRIGKEYLVDPKKDLIPVCPNCHAMLHKGELSPQQLKKTIKQQ